MSAEIKPFSRILCTWNGIEQYKREKRELSKQVNQLVSIQSALGQSAQGHKENRQERENLKLRRDALGVSIRSALGI